MAAFPTQGRICHQQQWQQLDDGSMAPTLHLNLLAFCSKEAPGFPSMAAACTKRFSSLWKEWAAGIYLMFVTLYLSSFKETQPSSYSSIKGV